MHDTLFLMLCVTVIISLLSFHQFDDKLIVGSYRAGFTFSPEQAGCNLIFSISAFFHPVQV